MEYRIEHDSMGEMKVPADRLWAAQTQRSHENFEIGVGIETMPAEIINAFGVLKKAAAIANNSLRPEKMTDEKLLEVEKFANEMIKEVGIQVGDMCRVEIIKDGYETVIRNGTQVFPTVVARQGVQMNPTQRGKGSYKRQNENVYNIGENVLFGNYPPKIPESDLKPLPPPSGFVVLDNPVVPEFVIVHDGLPDDTSAQDYWIPFKDYIKNVASSEIYKFTNFLDVAKPLSSSLKSSNLSALPCSLYTL